MEHDVPFGITMAGTDRDPVVLLRGEVDAGVSLEVVRTLSRIIDDGVSRVTVDLTDVTFIDSAGMNALVRTHVHGNALGTRLRIRGATGTARRALEICGLIALLET
jgi:anti-sigma B factor antagonist